jgi:hypothetical protein
MIFSQRQKAAQAASQWCRDRNLSPAVPDHIVTALDILGYLAPRGEKMTDGGLVTSLPQKVERPPMVEQDEPNPYNPPND